MMICSVQMLHGSAIQGRSLPPLNRHNKRCDGCCGQEPRVLSCRVSIAITTLLLVVGAAFFWLGHHFCRTQPDYREVERDGPTAAGHNMAADAEQPETPLLQNRRSHHPSVT